MFAKWLYIQNGHAMTHAVPCLSTWRTRFIPMPVHGGGLSDTGTGLSLSAVISYPILGLGGVIKVCCMMVHCSVLLWEKQDHVNVDVYWLLLLKNTYIFVYQTFIHRLGSWCCQHSSECEILDETNLKISNTYIGSCRDFWQHHLSSASQRIAIWTMCYDRITLCRERVSEKHPPLQYLWKCCTTQQKCHWLLGEKSDSFQNGKSRVPWFASPGLERKGHKTCSQVTLGNHSLNTLTGRESPWCDFCNSSDKHKEHGDMWGSLKMLCVESSIHSSYIPTICQVQRPMPPDYLLWRKLFRVTS